MNKYKILGDAKKDEAMVRIKVCNQAQQWWCTPLILALKRQVYLCEF